jgi:mono/diheme cytochrome c family protein
MSDRHTSPPFAAKALIAIGAAVAMVLASAGCQQKMAGQPSYRPLEPSEWFADQRSARPLVAGTVARGHLQTDLALFTGRKTRLTRSPAEQEPAPQPGRDRAAFDENRDFVDAFPIAVDEGLVRHGRDRYSIYCLVCHDNLGTGHGKIVERSYTRPPSYHIPRLREAPVGRLFAVITEGYGSMPSYAGQIPVEDRWAIVAYVRALQLSQHFPQEQR